MFSGQCRSVVRRVACRNLVDRPIAQGSHCALSSDVERSRYNEPGGSDQANEDKKKPNGNRCCCPYLLTKNLFEYVGVASLCVFLGYDIRRDFRSRSLQRQLREFSGPTRTSASLIKYVPKAFWEKFFGLNTVGILPIKSASASTSSAGFSEEEFKAMADGAGNALNNMIGVALIESGSAEDGVKFLEQCPNYGKSNYNLGVAHETGDVGGKPNLEKAFSYYEKGAALGNEKAMFNMAIYFLTGKGGKKIDILRGTQLLEKAQELGVPEAVEYIKILQEPRVTSGKSHFLKPSPGLHSSSSAPSLLQSPSWRQEKISRDPFGNCHDLYTDGEISFNIEIK